MNTSHLLAPCQKFHMKVTENKILYFYFSQQITTSDSRKLYNQNNNFVSASTVIAFPTSEPYQTRFSSDNRIKNVSPT